ncbi:hypothetical protein TRFO_29877 [Tritrichomonas foetus]|uniref:Leucine Rich Repeat family protein n=1 Tax=Tritrichomonas foetus TaxID=1144522 RepID=A0A1J4JV93_9EUKA|nr:hypothetical protein TRFO_29877 [Tritrichomonas foetus]|eukprot:OHT02931.1 hypothetical protein TRFO_29877 [Tritrichomonas foetus]
MVRTFSNSKSYAKISYSKSVRNSLFVEISSRRNRLIFSPFPPNLNNFIIESHTKNNREKMSSSLKAARSLRNALSTETADPVQSVAFDFGAEVEDDDDEQFNNWEHYTKLCYSQHPPIPALSLMKPILSGDEGSANFPHMEIGSHINIILQMLTKVKMINDLNLKDNALDSSCVEALINFVISSDQLSSLNLNDNPHIKAKAMKDLMEGIRESRSLESLSISNTGCNQTVGASIAEFVTNCSLLVKLDISSCQLRQSALDIATALGNATKLKRLNMADNELCIGGKKLAQQLGTGVTRGSTITRLYLSKNAINDEMAIALLKGLADSPTLKHLDLSYNQIGEQSGRSIASLIGKTTTLKHLDISMNPVLNVTINKELGQKASESDDGKPGNKKDKKPKACVPGVYSILTNLAKNSSLVDITMIGLVVEQAEWQQKLEQLKTSNQSVNVIYQAPRTETYNFQRSGAVGEKQEA